MEWLLPYIWHKSFQYCLYSAAAPLYFTNWSPMDSTPGVQSPWALWQSWGNVLVYVLFIAGWTCPLKGELVFIPFSLVGIQIRSLDWSCLKSLIPGFDDMLTNQRAWHQPVELALSVGRSHSWIKGQRKPTRPQSCHQSCQRRWPCRNCLSVGSPFTKGLPCPPVPQLEPNVMHKVMNMFCSVSLTVGTALI